MKKNIHLIIILFLATYIKTIAQEIPVKTSEVGLVYNNATTFGFRYKCGSSNTLFRLTALSITGSSTNTDYNNYSNLTNTGSIPGSTTSSIGAGLNLGFEKRKQMNDNMYVYWGIDWLNTYTKTNSSTITPISQAITYFNNNVENVQIDIVNNTSSSDTYTITTGLGVVLGAAYKISNSFSIEAEFIPSASYRYTKTITASTSYGVRWTGSMSAGYTPNPYTSGNINQTTVANGVTYGLTTNGSITLAYRIK